MNLGLSHLAYEVQEFGHKLLQGWAVLLVQLEGDAQAQQPVLLIVLCQHLQRSLAISSELKGRMASLRGSLHITTMGVRQMNSTGLAHRKEQQFRSLRWHLHGPGSI